MVGDVCVVGGTLGRGHAWQCDVHGRGDVCGRGHVWQRGGACIMKGHAWWWGHALQGVCIRGLCGRGHA